MLRVPSALAIVSFPPIASVSCKQMASPSPVPPNRRVVDASAWLNGSFWGLQARHENHVNVRRPSDGSDPHAKLQTIHDRHLAVDDEHVDLTFGDLVPRASPIPAGPAFMAEKSDHLLHDLQPE